MVTQTFPPPRARTWDWPAGTGTVQGWGGAVPTHARRRHPAPRLHRVAPPVTRHHRRGDTPTTAPATRDLMPTATRPRTQTHSPRTEVADKLSTTPTEVTSNPNVTPTAVMSTTTVATPPAPRTKTPSTAPPRPTQTGPHHTHTRQGTAVRATPSATAPTAQRPPATTPPRPHPEPRPASPTAPQHHHAAPPPGASPQVSPHPALTVDTCSGTVHAVSEGSPGLPSARQPRRAVGGGG
jgi:hypothetical protein